MNKYFTKINLLAIILAYCVIVLGAFVRVSDAGLGCPDWPGCYGQFAAPDNMEEITRAELLFPHKQVESTKAWKEMIHRYFASTLGFLIVVMAIIAWRNRHTTHQKLFLPVFLVALVIFQGMLGMWTVTLLLKPVIVTLHLLMGLSTLALLVWMYLRHTYNTNKAPESGNSIHNSLKKLGLAALLVLVLQLFLGGWTSTNYAALYCPDFPTCQGQWWPETDFSAAYTFIGEPGKNYEGGVLSNTAGATVHIMHRIGAVITVLILGFMSMKLLISNLDSFYKNIAMFILFVLLIQFSLGVANVLLFLPTSLAVAHNAFAALLLVSLVTLNYFLWIRNVKG